MADDTYPLVFGIVLTAGGALTCTLGAIDPLLAWFVQPECGGEQKRAYLIQKFNAHQNAIGVAMLAYGYAAMVLSAGYPDLATFSSLIGVSNLYAFAQLVIYPLLVVMLANAAYQHVSTYFPFVILGLLQGSALFGLSSVASDQLIYSYFSVYSGLFAVLPMFRFALSGELLRVSDGWVPLLGRLSTLILTIAYMLTNWLFAFLRFNTESIGLDTYLYLMPALAFGCFVGLALSGFAMAYDRSGAPSSALAALRKHK